MQDYNLHSLVKTLHGWRKPLVFTVLGVIILSAVISLFLPNYYRSTTVFYAASQDLFKPQKVFGYSQGEMYYYGGSEDIERLITAAGSHEVTDFLIEEYNLYEHYGIKPGSRKAEYHVREKLLKNYKITRTKYDALEISVEDTDPELAAKMANSARDKINSVITGVIKSSQQNLITSYRDAIGAKESGLNTIEDSLRKFQTAYGIYDPETQSEFLSTLVSSVETRLVRERAMLESYKSNRSNKGAADSIVHLQASIAGLEHQWEQLTGDDTTSLMSGSFRRFSEGKGRVELYDDAYKKAVNTLNVDRELLKQMQAAVALDVTAVHLIEPAAVPAVKHRPHRSLIVLASALGAFVFMVLGILLLESTRSQDWSFLRW